MITVDFYENSYRAEDATYSFDMPAVPRIGEKLTIADGMGGFRAQEVLDVQHTCFVGNDQYEFRSVRVLVSADSESVPY